MGRLTGEVVTAAIGNTHWRDNLNALVGVTGIIPAAGASATAGSGFTYTHTNGTGIYVFTFSPAFASTPVVVATTVAATGTSKIELTTVSASGFTANTSNSTNGGSGDLAFNFRANLVI